VVQLSTVGIMRALPDKFWIWVQRILIVLGGGVVGFVATCIIAIYYCGSSDLTNTYAEALFRNGIPEGVVCGFLGGGLVAFRLERHKREE